MMMSSAMQPANQFQLQNNRLISSVAQQEAQKKNAQAASEAGPSAPKAKAASAPQAGLEAAKPYAQNSVKPVDSFVPSAVGATQPAPAPNFVPRGQSAAVGSPVAQYPQVQVQPYVPKAKNHKHKKKLRPLKWLGIAAATLAGLGIVTVGGGTLYARHWFLKSPSKFTEKVSPKMIDDMLEKLKNGEEISVPDGFTLPKRNSEGLGGKVGGALDNFRALPKESKKRIFNTAIAPKNIWSSARLIYTFARGIAGQVKVPLIGLKEEAFGEALAKRNWKLVAEFMESGTVSKKMAQSLADELKYELTIFDDPNIGYRWYEKANREFYRAMSQLQSSTVELKGKQRDFYKSNYEQSIEGAKRARPDKVTGTPGFDEQKYKMASTAVVAIDEKNKLAVKMLRDDAHQKNIAANLEFFCNHYYTRLHKEMADIEEKIRLKAPSSMSSEEAAKYMDDLRLKKKFYEEAMKPENILKHGLDKIKHLKYASDFSYERDGLLAARKAAEKAGADPKYYPPEFIYYAEHDIPGAKGKYGSVVMELLEGDIVPVVLQEALDSGPMSSTNPKWIRYFDALDNAHETIPSQGRQAFSMDNHAGNTTEFGRSMDWAEYVDAGDTRMPIIQDATLRSAIGDSEGARKAILQLFDEQAIAEAGITQDQLAARLSRLDTAMYLNPMHPFIAIGKSDLHRFLKPDTTGFNFDQASITRAYDKFFRTPLDMASKIEDIQKHLKTLKANGGDKTEVDFFENLLKRYEKRRDDAVEQHLQYYLKEFTGINSEANKEQMRKHLRNRFYGFKNPFSTSS